VLLNKSITWLDGVDTWRMFAKAWPSRTTRQRLRIMGTPCRTGEREHFFNQRVINFYSCVQGKTVEATPLKVHKKYLDKCLDFNIIRIMWKKRGGYCIENRIEHRTYSTE